MATGSYHVVIYSEHNGVEKVLNVARAAVTIG